MDGLDHGFSHAAVPEVVTALRWAVVACALGVGRVRVPTVFVRDAID